MIKNSIKYNFGKIYEFFSIVRTCNSKSYFILLAKKGYYKKMAFHGENFCPKLAVFHEEKL
jgi:hypothetical protein